MLQSGFRYIGIGIAVENLKSDKLDLKIHLLEHMGDHSEVYKDGKDKKSKSSSGLFTQVPREATITARWTNHGSNRITPPTVRRGETVKVYQFGDEDKFLWDLYQYEPDVRGKEVVVHAFSNIDRDNKSKFLEKLNKKNTYYFRVDTIKKKVELKTNRNDKERKAWHILLNLKEDLLSITNKQVIFKLGQNKLYIKVASAVIETKKTTLKASSSMIIDTPNLTIKGGSVKMDSSVKFNKSTSFNASAKLNGNAKTTDGAKVK
jgi:hypothetical protein